MRRYTSPVALLSAVIVLSLVTSALAGITIIPGQGILFTSGQGVMMTGADGVMMTGADGVIMTGADGVMMTGADVVTTIGADSLTYTGPLATLFPGVGTGLRSVDTELALILNTLPDTSAISVVVVFHHLPTEADLDALQAVGILGGTRFHNLPMVIINAFKDQVAAISQMPSVRSIYSNKTLGVLTHDTRRITRQTRILADQALTQRNGGVPLSGQGVTVAVIDTGIDATHPDLPLGTRVVQNAVVADPQGLPPGFVYPIVTQGIPNTDLVMGHGTFVAGIIAGTGAASDNYFGGMAPGARIFGVSAGPATLLFVLSAMDYVLSNRESHNIRVVNCSFGVSGLFDANDPINITTKIMHDAGMTVVFSAGNRGDQPNALNPYSVADWVIGVGSVTKQGSLSAFSSRGAAAYGLYHPTMTAPGENIVSAKAFGTNLVGVQGLASAASIPIPYLLSYTTSSGTSFAAPHVAGTIALMLEANPALTPDQIKTILQETATPMLGYSRYEVGAGQLNAYAAVRKAAGLGDRLGQFRQNLSNACTLTRDPVVSFTGQVAPGEVRTTTLDVPQDTVALTVQVGWTGSGVLSNPLSVTLANGVQTVSSKPAALLAGPLFQKTGVVLADPTPGQWTITVRNTGLPLLGGVQKFIGAIEVVRATYNVTGFEGLSSAQQIAVKRALRSGLVTAQSGLFSAGAPATRLALAQALMLGANSRVPQFLPDTPTFSDVPLNDAVFVESTVHSPEGNLMDATGGAFNPQSSVDRLTVAIAVVRALGLEELATQQLVLINPGIADWFQIPTSKRGYVKLAVSGNLMSTIGGYFRPSYFITQADLAETAVSLQRASR